MSERPPFFINLNGILTDIGMPKVMGVLNVTPDSFYAASRKQGAGEISARVLEMLEAGADIIDVGACSSRPGAGDVSVDEELARLTFALDVLRRAAPDAVVSVDTFRAAVARRCVEDFGVQMINDISGGELDAGMFETVAELQVPYVLMHMKGTPRTMQQNPHYDNLMVEILQYFGRRVEQLHELGVKDIILDPGFGFGKTMAHNYELMRRLPDLRVLGLPLLVGISRKSMICRLLDVRPEEALNGTTVLNTVALLKGANILRVHDVRAAVEAVRIVEAVRGVPAGK